MITTQSALIELAAAIAKKHSLDPALVCAVCEEESGLRDAPPGGKETWNTWSVRYEPGFQRQYVRPVDPDNPTTEEVTKAMSFGLMQVMGETAIEFGFNGKFLTLLCNPATGLEYGCRKLVDCLKNTSGDLTKALLEYNGGGDPNYPSQVIARMAKYA